MSNTKPKLAELLEKTEKKQEAYYLLAKQCEAYKSSAQLLVDQYSRYFRRMLKTQVLRGCEILQRYKFSSVRVQITQSGTMDCHVNFKGHPNSDWHKQFKEKEPATKARIGALLKRKFGISPERVCLYVDFFDPI